MSEDVRIWVEIVFNITYLAVVWGLVVMMWRRRQGVAAADQRVANLITWAFALLALGDTGHVGFRVLAYAQGDLESKFTSMGAQVGLVGFGALATAMTVTGFYVLMLFVWRERFKNEFGWFEYLLLTASVARLGIMIFPDNAWSSVEPPQPWSTYRNLPLMLLGLGVAHLFLRDARAAKDRTFWRMGVMIVVSYACYIPVILFVQQAPVIGMLMIPKTLAYVAIAVLAYVDLFRGAEIPRTAAQGAGD